MCIRLSTPAADYLCRPGFSQASAKQGCHLTTICDTMQLVPACPIAPLFYGAAVTACCQTRLRMCSISVVPFCSCRNERDKSCVQCDVDMLQSSACNKPQWSYLSRIFKLTHFSKIKHHRCLCKWNAVIRKRDTNMTMEKKISRHLVWWWPKFWPAHNKACAVLFLSS